MKFFLDTANIKEIEEAVTTGLIDGVTTNPSLVSKESKPFKEMLKIICDLVKGPVSAEVVSTTYQEMITEARPLLEISPHIVIKLPLTPDGLRACKTLSSEGKKTNVTLCFSASQALLAAKAGATYISPFIGRLDDISESGIQLISDIRAIYAPFGFSTQVLAASIRHPRHIVESAQLGADVATMPYSVFKQLYKHPLTDIGLEKFISDWSKAVK